jgi:hypothetical protein
VRNYRSGGQRIAQLPFDPHPPLHVGVHIGLEKPDGRLSLGLGAIERKIGATHKLVTLRSIVGSYRNANAHAQRRWSWSNHERFSNRPDNSPS